MMANPELPLYRYDPYAKAFTHEQYDHVRMRSLRRDAVERASSAKQWGLVLGTLGAALCSKLGPVAGVRISAADAAPSRWLIVQNLLSTAPLHHSVAEPLGR